MQGYNSTIAETYNRYLVPLFFEPFAVDLVEKIKGNPAYILELACGTGIITRYIISQLTKESVVYATDIKAEMLALAQSSIQDDRIRWQIADAHSLPFEDGSIDVVICQFGVMFFEDKSKAFAEAYRVLRNGGQFLFNTWDTLETNDITNISQQAIKELYGAEAPDFSLKGPYSFFDKAEIGKLLQNAGFKDFTIHKKSKRSGNLSLDEIVTGITEGSPLSSYFQKKYIDTSAFKTRFKEKLATNTGKNRFNMQALVVVAEK